MSCIGFLAAGALALSASGATSSGGEIYLSESEIRQIQNGTGCRNLVRQFFALQSQMSKGELATDYYDLKILPIDELVTGRKGKYYSVHLKDANRRARFVFPGGRYVLPDASTRFRRSLSAFVRDVLAKIVGGAEYEIFVRGSGSSTPMAGTKALVEGARFNRIIYAPKVAPQKYEGERRRVHSVLNQYKNEDLPFLRAAFLQDTVAKIYPIKKPIILQSEVSDSKASSAQFAELILFVDW